MALIFVSFLKGELRRKIHTDLKSTPSASSSEFSLEALKTPLGRVNERWQKVQDRIGSGNPADWKLAIIEADIILDEMLQKMGYHGVGVGEMLKAVEKTDFATLNDAWEAHKIRNTIAHEGEEFIISRPEATRVINLYKKVFEEFFYI